MNGYSVVMRLYSSGILFLLTAALTGAQPVPKLNTLTPAWLQRGTSNEVVFSGENLQGASSVLVSGDRGVTVQLIPAPAPPVALEASRGGISIADGSDSRQVRARIILEPTASLNARQLRIATENGVSNPLTLRVSSVPEVREARQGSAPQKVELPVGLSGTMASPGERDVFEFEARRGQELIIDVLAFRTGSPLDSSLSLLNARGEELARSEDAKGFDSFLHFTVPEDGTYRVELRDFRYGGSDRHEYHLTIGALPYVASVFPAGARRGQSVQVALQGINLGLDSLWLRPEADAPVGWQEIRIQTAHGLSTGFPFHVSDMAETIETEPNDAAGQAKAVAVPAVLNGRIGGAGDRDHFKFKVNQAQRLVCEVIAQRLGSPLDSVLVLRDAAGKVVNQNDDAEGADARIEFAAEKDREYVLDIRDLLDRGGQDYVYRISLRPPEPEFTVRYSPDNPRLNCGGRAILRCEVNRKAGFSGPVRLVCADLPAGVVAEPVLMNPDDPAPGLLVLTAGANAAGGAHRFRVLASGVRDGERVEVQAEPFSGDSPVNDSFLTVAAAPPPFALELVTLSLALEQDQSGVLEVLVHRQEGFDREIRLSAEGFSSGREPLTRNVEFQPVTIQPAETRARLTLKARMDSEIGSRPIYIKGEATAEGQTLAQFSQTIPLTLRQLPFALLNTMKRLSVAVLPPGSQSAASEAEFAVRASRRGWFTDEIQLALEGLPDGVAATQTNLASRVGEVTFKLSATDKAPVDKEFPITVVGSATIEGRTYRQRTAPMTLSITKPPDLAGAD